MTASTTRETADHAELARLAEAATAGPWYAYHGRGAARWFVGGHQYGPDIDPSDIAEMQNDGREDNARFIAAFDPTTCSALLSEIAALRGERDGLKHAEAVAADMMADRATQAERQRDEALDAARKLSAAISWTDYPFIDNNTSREEMISRLGFMQKDAEQPRAFLANQGADQSKTPAAS